MRKATPWIGGLAVLFLVAVGIAWPSDNGTIRIVNAGTDRIAYGTVEICAQRFTLEDLKPGEDKVFRYKVRSYSHYSVNIRFEAGALLHRQLGYVTNGLNYKDILTIDGGVTLSQTWR